MTDPSIVLAVATGVLSLVAVLSGLVAKQTATQLKAVKDLLPALQAPAADTSGRHRAVSDMLDLGERVARLETLAAVTASQFTELKSDLGAVALKVDAMREQVATVATGFHWLQLACEHCQPSPAALRILPERKP